MTDVVSTTILSEAIIVKLGGSKTLFLAGTLAPRPYYSIFIGVVLSHLALIWSVQFLPLIDLPMHLANAFILAHYSSIPSFHALYKIQLQPIPNVGYFFILTPLITVVSPQVAAKIFLSLVIVLYALGCHLLGRAVLRDHSWNAVFCLFFLTGWTFVWGFINYLLGIGLLFITLAVWIEWRRDWSVLKILSIVSLSLSAYFVHLTSFGFFAVAIFIWSAYEWRVGQPIIPLAIDVLVPIFFPVILFCSFMRGSGTIGRLALSSIREKLGGLVGVVGTYQHFLNIWSSVLSLILLILVIRSVDRWRLQRQVAVLAAVFVASYFLCPSTLMTSWAADMRFVTPMGVLALYSFKVESLTHRGKTSIAVLLAFFMVRLLVIESEWRPISTQVAHQVGIMDQIDTGAKVFTIMMNENRDDWRRNGVLFHIPDYAIITRRAQVSSHSALPAIMPVAYRNPLYSPLFPDTSSPEDFDWTRIFSKYDYIWGSDLTPAFQIFLDTSCIVLDSANDVRLYKVRSKWRVN